MNPPYAHRGMRHHVQAAAEPLGLADTADAHPLAWAESCRPLQRVESLILTAAVQRSPEATAAVLADCRPHVEALGLALAATRHALADAHTELGLDVPGWAGEPPVIDPDAFAALEAKVAGLEAWQAVAADSNKAVDAYLRSLKPDLPEHFGMPVEGVQMVFDGLKTKVAELEAGLADHKAIAEAKAAADAKVAELTAELEKATAPAPTPQTKPAAAPKAK